MPHPKIVEVSQDALGYLLVYARDWEGNREGEPLGEPDYYKTRSAAQRAAKMVNDVPNPGPIQMSK
jgi:hypothetical protein